MDEKSKFVKAPHKLEQYLKGIPNGAIAFSGGVDSSYLLYAATVSGMKVHAYYVNSQFQPQFELDDALRMVDKLGVEMTVIPLDIFLCSKVVENPVDRCYHCKQVIFQKILEYAKADGYTTLLDGTNASDEAGDRPGMKALQELKVISPLQKTEITKSQVRELSREAGLFTWDKPAYACLATRIPTGTAIEAGALIKIEKTENKLFEMGFTNFRARILGEAVKIQLPAEQFSMAIQCHKELRQELSEYFQDVLLDLSPRYSSV